METEIPAVFREREKHYDDRFATFKSNAMKQVTKRSLPQWIATASLCMNIDAAVDVMGYAVWLPLCQWG